MDGSFYYLPPQNTTTKWKKQSPILYEKNKNLEKLFSVTHFISQIFHFYKIIHLQEGAFKQLDYNFHIKARKMRSQ